MPISDGLISARQLCSNSVDTRNIAPGAVTPTEVLTGFNFVELVTVLPTTGNFEGRMVYLTTDDKLYRHDGAAFLLAVDGADITAATISGDRMIANTITAGEIQAGAIGASELAAVNIEVGKFIRSTTFVSGSSGWSIDADGTAEFDDVIVRGTIQASSIEGNVTLGTGGVFRTATSGQRVEITDADFDKIQFFTGEVGETAPGQILGGGSGGAANLQIISPKDGTGNQSALGFLTRGSSDAVIDVTGQIEADDLKTVSSPAYSFSGDGDTGMYRFASNTLGLVAGGTEGIRINATDMLSIGGATGEFSIRHSSAGSASFPAYAFVGDTDTGMYRIGTNILGFAAGGSRRFSVQSDFMRFGDGTTTGTQAIKTTAGTVTSPGFTFNGDGNTGMYRIAADQIGFATNGVVRFAVVNTEVQARGDNGAHFFDYAPASAGTIDAQWFNAGGNVRRLDVVSSRLSGKQDVIPLDDFLNTAAVLDLALIAFRMKDDPDGPTQIGTTALSVGKHLPALAYKRGREWDFGQYSRLVIPLIAEVRKLRDRVDVLEAA